MKLTRYSCFALALLLCCTCAAQAEPNGTAVFKEAQTAFRAAKYQQALELFKTASQLEPSLKAEALLYRGIILAQQKQWRKAVTAIVKAKNAGLTTEGLREANMALLYVAAYGDLIKYVDDEPGKSTGWFGPRDGTSPWSFKASIGGASVDGLMVEPALTATNDPVMASDVRIELDGHVTYRHALKDNQKLAAGYDFSSDRYTDASEFNLMSHVLWGTYSRPVKRVRLNVNGSVGIHTLDGNAFLNRYSARASAFFPEMQGLYGKVQCSMAQSSYDANSALDKTDTSIALSQYWYILGNRVVLSGSAIMGMANADTNLWSNSNSSFVLGATHKLAKKHKARVFVSMASYDYDGLDTIETTKKRSDDIIAIDANYIYELNDATDVTVRFLNFDNSSNLSRQNYVSRSLIVAVSHEW